MTCFKTAGRVMYNNLLERNSDIVDRLAYLMRNELCRNYEFIWLMTMSEEDNTYSKIHIPIK